MSRDVASLVYSRRCGSMARKAVLAYFAERANDDGTGVWASKQRIADEIECSKQTVIRAVKSLEDDGLIAAVGKRKTQGGFTVVYDIILPAVNALERAKRQTGEAEIDLNQSHSETPNQSHKVTGPSADQSHSDSRTSHTARPKPSSNRPKSDATHPPSGREVKPHRIPDDWMPGPLPENVQALVDLWPPGRLDREIDGFRDYWIARTRDFKRSDWDRTLWNRIRDVHDKVMRDNRNARPTARNDHPQNPFVIAGFEREAERAGAEWG